MVRKEGCIFSQARELIFYIGKLQKTVVILKIFCYGFYILTVTQLQTNIHSFYRKYKEHLIINCC